MSINDSHVNPQLMCSKPCDVYRIITFGIFNISSSESVVSLSESLSFIASSTKSRRSLSWRSLQRSVFLEFFYKIQHNCKIGWIRF